MIIFSHGDKGGVGKSSASTIAVETLLCAGRQVLLVEADLKSPDVAGRYAKTAGVHAVASTLNRAGDSMNAVGAFAEAVEDKAKDRDIVVNLPAGAGDTLDELADMLVETLTDIGQKIAVIYSLGPSKEQSESLEDSISNGLVGAVDPDKVLVTMAGWQNKPENFVWLKSKMRDPALEAGLVEYVVPKITPDAVHDNLNNSTGRLTEFEESLKTFNKIAFRRWRTAYQDQIAALIERASS